MSSFCDFVLRGNVVDLAVAVVIGAAFTGIVSSLTDDMLMPVVGWVAGDMDFANYFILLGEVPPGVDSTSYAALKAAGVAMIGYGQFVTALVNFLVVAFVVWMIVRAVKKAMREAPPAAAADPAELILLREIRDELRAGRGAAGTSN